MPWWSLGTSYAQSDFFLMSINLLRQFCVDLLLNLVQELQFVGTESFFKGEYFSFGEIEIQQCNRSVARKLNNNYCVPSFFTSLCH